MLPFATMVNTSTALHLQLQGRVTALNCSVGQRVGHSLGVKHMAQELNEFLQARSMTDKAKIAAAGAMNNVRTAIDSAKRIGFNGNTVSLCTAANLGNGHSHLCPLAALSSFSMSFTMQFICRAAIMAKIAEVGIICMTDISSILGTHQIRHGDGPVTVQSMISIHSGATCLVLSSTDQLLQFHMYHG